jgi:hypothetical protein
MAKMAVMTFASDPLDDGAAGEPSATIFTDVPEDSPFYHYVYQADAMGLMHGLTADTFGPDVPATRQPPAGHIAAPRVEPPSARRVCSDWLILW